MGTITESFKHELWQDTLYGEVDSSIVQPRLLACLGWCVRYTYKHACPVDNQLQRGVTAWSFVILDELLGAKVM